MLKDRERIIYLDILRIIAVVAVICIHSGLGAYFFWAVPLFVMISGSLWLSKEGEIDIKKLWSVNILRIITAFVFWSTFYTLVHALFLPNLTGEKVSIKDTLVMLLQGRYHLWFCYLIFGIYVGLPFLKRIADKEFLVKYLIGITFFFSILVPCIQTIPKIEWTTWMTDIINWNWSLYLFYFMTGYYFNKINLERKSPMPYLIYAGGIISILCIVSGLASGFGKLFECSILLVIFCLCKEITNRLADKLDRGG